MWDLAIPANRPLVSAPNAWEPSGYQTPGIPSSESPRTPATIAADSKCSPVRPELYHFALTGRRACTNTISSVSAIATGSMNASIADTGMTTIQVINAIRSAQDEWIENQLRKIETLYHYHKEKQDGQRN